MKKVLLSISVLGLLSLLPACNDDSKISQTGSDLQAPGAPTPTPSPFISPTPTPIPTPTATPTPISANTPAATKISFLLTNDIHGYLTPNLTYVSGIAKQLRDLPEYQNDQSALFVLDSGDQFQGTLLSNYDEGVTVFNALNSVQYDAIIPGNHDYDFGPIGWLWDQVTPQHNDGGPRGAITKLAGIAHFPMLSANTYYKSSITAQNSVVPVAVDDSCVPSDSTFVAPLDFTKVTRPDFLQPYTIITKAGVRVALIGIDFHLTTSTTTAANVSDLCFRDEVSAYLDVRKQLEGQADVFVLMMHNGDVPYAGNTNASDITKKINAAYPYGVQLVASGHTHMVYNVNVDGVPVMQDGCDGASFGRVDLFVDPTTKKVLPAQTQSWAGMNVSATKCSSTDPRAAFICNQLSFPIASDPTIDALIAQATANIAPIALEKLATVTETVTISRIGESALGDILADALRKATGTQTAFMNTGGIRTNLHAGDMLYQDLFAVSPFQNLAVVINQFPWPSLKQVLLHAINTCGSYGTLVESGLKIQYTGTACDPQSQLYGSSSLVHVETIDGDVLFDQATNFDAPATKTLSVTTLDFLSAGGDGYPFNAVPVDQSLGIARDMIKAGFEKDQPTLNNTIDGRYTNVALTVAPAATPAPAIAKVK